MKIIGLILFLIASYQTYGQSQIRGRILDYKSGEVLPWTVVSIKESNSVKAGAITDKDGIFLIDSIEHKGQAALVISLLTYETLLIKNIELGENQKLDIGNIYLIEGSYIWDGECTTKYLFGLIKVKRGCGGNNVGLIEKNRGKNQIVIKYPKEGNDLTFDIASKRLEIDYQMLAKNNKP